MTKLTAVVLMACSCAPGLSRQPRSIESADFPTTDSERGWCGQPANEAAAAEFAGDRDRAAWYRAQFRSCVTNLRAQSSAPPPTPAMVIRVDRQPPPAPGAHPSPPPPQPTEPEAAEAVAPKPHKRTPSKPRASDQAADDGPICGNEPVRFDGVFVGAEAAFTQAANDPGSVDFAGCGEAVRQPAPLCWVAMCDVRAKNAYGALILLRVGFSKSAAGWRLTTL